MCCWGPTRVISSSQGSDPSRSSHGNASHLHWFTLWVQHPPGCRSFSYPCSKSHHFIFSQLNTLRISLQFCTGISFTIIVFPSRTQRISLHLPPTRHATTLPIYLPARRHNTLHHLRRRMWRLLGSHIPRLKTSLPRHSNSKDQACDHDSSLLSRNRQRVSHASHHAIALQLHVTDKGVWALLLLRLSGAVANEAQHMSDMQGRALRRAMQEVHG